MDTEEWKDNDATALAHRTQTQNSVQIETRHFQCYLGKVSAQSFGSRIHADCF